ncbi:MAG: hypothetical protein A2284_09830 [Deltaproteobacteria bacterium RIFOXYA12_FULL_61_11]|nr:MAG: hypothetical protein A2284_09830 [Deltaproteobacteria bacterium RIFOXYA12_FULL_61_11]
MGFLLALPLPSSAESPTIELAFTADRHGRTLHLHLDGKPALRYTHTPNQRLGDASFLQHPAILDFRYHYLERSYFLYHALPRGTRPELLVVFEPSLLDRSVTITTHQQGQILVYLIGDLDLASDEHLEDWLIAE